MSNFRQLGFLSNVRHLFNKFYDLFLIVMTSIGFVIEILSYNWSIITHQESSIVAQTLSFEQILLLVFNCYDFNRPCY